MTRFELVLKNDKTKQYDRLTLLLIIINIFVFIYLAIFSSEKNIRISAIGGAVVNILALMIDRFLQGSKNNKDTPYRIYAFYLASFAWLNLGYWWIWLLCTILGMLYQVAKRKLSVIVLQDKIIYPSFPVRKIEWNELSNIILKDGLLTIDFKNNRIFQSDVNEVETEVNEIKFNEFCRSRLTIEENNLKTT